MKQFAIVICGLVLYMHSALLATPKEAGAAPIGSEYQFVGRHLMASYKACDHQALINIDGLKRAMLEAVNASGAHLLDSCDYVFAGNGVTSVLLLSESHASIHTYPEYNSCFVDIFTCGTKCSQEQFHEVLKKYLKPQQVTCDIVNRN